MIPVKKTGAILILFILTFSLFSSLITPNRVKAQPEDEDLSSLLLDLFQLLGDINFDGILNPHPFRYVGVWQSNDTRTIKGDMDFTLYFSTTILNQLEFLGYQDKISVSVYHFQSNTSEPKKIKEKKDLTLGIGSIDERVRQLPLTITDLEISLEEGDYILFGIQINQTKKPLSDIAERRFEKKLKPRLQRLSDILEKSDDPQLQEFGMIMDLVLENFSKLNLGGKEFGSLVNVLVSSAFYYGSDTYKSRVSFSSEAAENFTLYFRSEGDYLFESIVGSQDIAGQFVEGYFKITNKTVPSSSVSHAWPPLVIDTETDISGDYSASADFTNWIVLWALYTLETPFEAKGLTDTLYLKNNFKMSPGESEGETQRERLSKESTKWVSPSINRNRIIQNITAELYLHYPKLITIGDIKIKASLIDEDNDNEVIANETKSIDKTTLSEFISRGPYTPTTFNFDNFKGGYEIFYNHNLSLEVKIIKKPLLSLRSPKLLYNSEQYPSFISYVYNETENIEIEEFEDKKEIYAGATANFEINISSEYADKLNIEIEDGSKKGEWDVAYNPENIDVESKSNTTVNVTVKSMATDETAYENGDQIILFFNVSGKTGVDNKKISVYVKESAVEYDIELIIPDEIEIKHGKEQSYEFIIKNKNTGFLTDSYGISISTKHDLYKNYYHVTDVPVYDNNPENERPVNITIQIPAYTDISKDKLILTIISNESISNANDTSWEYKLNISIITPNILENIYHLFEQLSEKIGLDDHLGDNGAWLLIGIFTIIIIILIFIIVSLIKRRYATLICLERIKEITSYEKAEFEITFKNPYKKTLTYDINLKTNDEIKERWDITIEKKQITLEPEESDFVRFTVEPTDYVKPEDFAEVRVIAKPVNKKKKSTLDTITVIKQTQIDAKISGVLHWPKTFKKGDRIETSFKLFNRGNVSAENLTITLFINCEEKNKIENVSIPRGGYADIKIPWIAKKGKNKIEIIVK